MKRTPYRRSLLFSMRSTAALIGVLVALAGCALHGPALTPTSHLAYNEALQQSERRELLLNLVRLRYLVGPEFLAIASISSHMEFDARASLSGDFGKDRASTTRLITPGASLGYSESPTVTFAPQQGDEFTRRLVAPVDLDKVYLLVRYGWSLERTLRLVVEQLNDLRNVATRETLTAEDIESLDRFAEVARTMESLYAQHRIDIDSIDRWRLVSGGIPADRLAAQDFVNAAANGYRLEHDREAATYALQVRAPGYFLRVAPEAHGSSDVSALLTLLGLAAGESLYELDASAAPADPGSVLAIRTRSVLGAMAYLSHGVAIPAADIASGAAGPNELDGSANQTLIRVLFADEPPTGASLAVPYREHWFYIDDRDLESRRTLGALSSLVRLQIGAGDAQSVPVLTLPVSR